MAKAVGDLGLIDEALLATPDAVHTLVAIFRDERIQPKNAIRVVKPYLKAAPSAQSSAKLYAAFLCVFGVELPFSRILLANLPKHGQSLRVHQHIESAYGRRSDESQEEYTLLQALAAVAVGNDDLAEAERIYRRGRASKFDDIRTWSGIRLGSLVGIPLDEISQTPLADAADRMPKKLQGRVVVLAEQGARLDLLANVTGLQNAELTVYSNDDVAAELEGLDANFGSYRDKVPDHSDASMRIYKFASDISQALTRSHEPCFPESEQDWIKQFGETTSLAYEDRVASILTSVECFDACLDEVDAQAIILVGGAANQLVRMLPYLFRNRSLDNVYFLPLFDVPATQEAALVLAQELLTQNKTQTTQATEVTQSESSASTSSTLELRKAFQLKVASDALLLKGNYVLLAGHLQQRNYAATTTALLDCLHQNEQQVLVYDSSHLPFSKTNSVYHKNLADLEAVVDQDETFSALFQRMSAKVDQAIHNHQIYNGGSVNELLSAILRSFVNKELRLTLSRFVYFEELFTLCAPRVVVLSTSRWVAVRGLSIIAKQLAIPTIDVQSLNVLEHPKYKSPVADKATVIDQMSLEVYRDYLNYPEQDIFITGTPRVDEIRASTMSLSVEGLRRKFDLPDNDRPTLMFASQLQPLERCLSILTEMCAVSKDCGASLIIKLHPREGISRRQAYEGLIERGGVKNQTAILGPVPIQEVLAVSQVVVTMFSNVAREALLAGREVIIANYFDTQLPIRFDLDSGATGAYSAAELRELLSGAVKHSAASQTYEIAESEYMRANPHLATGGSVERIIQHALAAALPGQTRQYPIPAVDNSLLIQDNATDLIELVTYALTDSNWEPALTLFDRMLNAGLSDSILSQALAALSTALDDNAPHAHSRNARITDAAAKAISTCAKPHKIEEAAAQCAASPEQLKLIMPLIENHSTLSDPATTLFNACIQIAQGSLNRAKSLLLTIPSDPNYPNNGKIGTYLGELATSLQPNLATSTPATPSEGDFDNIRNGLLFVEKGVAAEIVQDEIATMKYALVVCEATETIARLSGVEVDIRSIKDYFDDFSPVIAKVVREVAEEFSESFAQIVAELLETEAEMDFGHRHHKAVSNWMRQALADPTHRCYTARSVIREHLARPTVILAYNPTSVPNYWEVELRQQNLWFLAADNNTNRLPRLNKAIQQQMKDLISPVTATGAPALQSQLLTDELVKFRNTLSQPILPTTDKDRVLIVVRWKLKTTPPTFVQLLSQMPEHLHTVLIGADVAGDVSEITQHFDEQGTQALAEGRLSCIPKPALTASPPPEWVADRISQILAHRCLNDPTLRLHGLDLRTAVQGRIKTFVRLALFTLILIDHESKRYLAGPGRSIVAVTPGRHPEAIVAQTNAHALGKQSLDIQVAYWSKTFRYIPPYGTLISVIDRWSADMITNHFKVPAEVVHTIGTPRFDLIAQQFSKEATASTTPSNVVFADATLPLVTFATQPGLLSEKTLITQQICETTFDCGPINVLIKLHPQDTEQLETYQQMLAGFNLVNTVQIVKEASMQALITESDVIVTIYSNVGIEAAIMGKRLLIVNLGEDMPLPLDKFNIGANAFNANQISDQLNRLLTDPSFAKDIEQSRQSFFDENPQLLRGDSARAIWNLLIEKLA